MLSHWESPVGCAVARARIIVLSLCVILLASTGAAQSEWQALSALQPGDRIRIKYRKGTDTAAFSEWRADQITAGGKVSKREDIVRIERYRPGGWGRGKKAALGAAIGGGTGATIGAVLGRRPAGFGPFFSSGQLAVMVGVPCAIVGGAVGALLPHHRWTVVYAAK